MKRKYSACRNKKKYNTFQEAKIASAYLKKNTKIITKAYHCSKCKHFHIGKVSYYFNNAVWWHNIKAIDTTDGLQRYKESLKNN